MAYEDITTGTRVIAKKGDMPRSRGMVTALLTHPDDSQFGGSNAGRQVAHIQSPDGDAFYWLDELQPDSASTTGTPG